MLTAAEAAGTHPIICSSFRTYDYQENLRNRIERAEREEHLEGTEAEEAAAFWVAPPGASEHQTGLAVDIVDADYLELDEGQEPLATQLDPLHRVRLHPALPHGQKRHNRHRVRALALPLRGQRGRLRHSGKRSLPRRVARRNVPRPGLKPPAPFSATAPFRSRPLRNLPSPKPRNKNAEPSSQERRP